MKKILPLLMCFSLAGVLFAQEASLSDPDGAAIGVDAASAALTEVSLDLFEREGSWTASMSSDDGLITSRLFDGLPAGKSPLPDMGDAVPEDTKVLGVKVEFYKRGLNSFFIKAIQPIPIEGNVKTISFWVVGRNQDHRLSVVVRDYFQRTYELFVGTLDFEGWKKLTVSVPPSPDDEHGIVQRSPYYGDRAGLSFVGFKVECNPVHARGTYYVYFDDLRALTDLYEYNYKHGDMTGTDMMDAW